MVERRIFFRRLISFAFFRHHVQNHRTVKRTNVAQHRDKIFNVMSVNRTVVVQIESGKKSGVRRHKIDRALLHALK